MNNSSKIVLGILTILIIIGGVLLLVRKPASSPASRNQNSGSSATDNTIATKAAATITYDGSTFSPELTTVKSGSTVKITNNGPTVLDMDSDPHPTHTDNPELNVGDVAAGESKAFTVTTKGQWGFHNHLNPSQHGRLTVE